MVRQRRNRARTLSFVVEGDVGADLLHELHLLIGTSGPDDLETLLLRNLNHYTGGRMSIIVMVVVKRDKSAHDPTAPAPADTKTTSPYSELVRGAYTLRRCLQLAFLACEYSCSRLENS
jgi:hypothetical protein